MADYATLKAGIQQYIKENHNNDITGNLLQQQLLAMVNSLGANYQFAGIATPTTNPGTPDQNVFYIAGPGSYPNFNNANVPDGYLGVFKYNGSWEIQTVVVGKTYNEQTGKNTLKTLIFQFDASINGVINADGTVSSSQNYRVTDFLPVVAGQKITYNMYGGNALHPLCLAFYTNTDVSTFVNGVAFAYETISPAGPTTGEFTVENNGYIRLCCASQSSVLSLAYAYLDAFPSGIQKKFEELANVSDQVQKNMLKTLILPYDITANGIIMADGTIAATTSYGVSDFLPVITGQKIVYRVFGGTKSHPLCLAFYSAKNVSSFVSGVVFAATSVRDDRPTVGEFDVTADGYIRVCYAKSLVSDSYIYLNDIPTSVEKRFEQVGGLIEEKVAFALEEYKERTFIMVRDLNNNKVINANGTTSNSNNYRTSDFLPVKSGDVISYCATGGNANYPLYLALYSSNDESTFISGLAFTTTTGRGSEIGTYTIPQNGYIKISHIATNYGANDYFAFFSLIGDTLKRYIYERENTVIWRNNPIADVANAVCSFNRNHSYYKAFCLLISGDIHGDKPRMKNIVEYLNGITKIDAGIMLGDIDGSNFADVDDSEAYTAEISQSTKPFLTVIGNHDAGSTNVAGTSYSTIAQLVARFITPNIPYAQLASGEYVDGNSYYFKDFATYKIRVIVLNEYDYPDADAVSSPFAYIRGFQMFSQAQINWFISTLNSTPSDYHVIVAMHSNPDIAKIKLDNPFTVEGVSGTYNPESYIDGPIIADIINAWQNGATLNKTYSILVTSVLTQLNAVADFTTRGAGIFVCYLGGHWHNSLVSSPQTYQNTQLQYNVDVASYSNGVYHSMTPRLLGTRSEDSFCLISVNTILRKINFVRIGAHITNSMKDIFVTQISY